MAVTPRSDAFAGGNDPRNLANVIYMNASWIYRRSKELIDEQALGFDVLKLYDLVHKCRQYRDECDKARDANGDLQNVLKALIDLVRETGTGNPTKTDAEINAEFKSLYQAAGVFFAWAEANLPGVGQTVASVTLTMVRVPWVSPFATQFTARVPVVQAVLNRITTLNAEFG